MIDLTTHLDNIAQDERTRTLLQYFYDKGALDYRDNMVEKLTEMDGDFDTARLVQSVPFPQFTLNSGIHNKDEAETAYVNPNDLGKDLDQFDDDEVVSVVERGGKSLGVDKHGRTYVLGTV